MSSASFKFRLAAGATVTVGAIAFLAWLRRRRKLTVRISKLCVYPIKSCKGLSVEQARLTAAGLAHDREYIVVRAADGKAVALTAREVPQLVLIAPEMPTDHGITVHKAGMRSLFIPAQGGPKQRIEYHEWEDAVEGVDQGDEAAAWFCEALGEVALRLVRFTGTRTTPCPERYGDGLTMFSDGFGMLLTSEASLADLEIRTGLSHMRERMRPNIVVSGCEAYGEDSMPGLMWNGGACWAKLRLPKPCARCVIPRVDPTTGAPGQDPLRTMKPYRSGRNLMSATTAHRDHYVNNKGEIFFGQNVNSIVTGDVIIRVGDKLFISP